MKISIELDPFGSPLERVFQSLLELAGVVPVDPRTTICEECHTTSCQYYDAEPGDTPQTNRCARYSGINEKERRGLHGHQFPR